MKPGSALIAFLLAATVLALSGCVSNGDPEQAPALTGAPPATFDDATGGIEGTVADDEQQPVAGAEVGIPALELSTVTDLEGAFSFSNLAPGAYNLYVLKLGYQSAVRPVDVTAGDVQDVSIQLTPTAITGAYQVLLTQRGLFGCGASWAPGMPPEPAPGLASLPLGLGEGLPNRVGGLAGCGSFSNDNMEGTPVRDLDQFRLNWNLEEPMLNWKTGVFEMKWTTNQLAGRGLSMAWEVDECYNRGTAFEFARAEGGSPLRVQADEDLIQSVISNGTATDLCSEAPANCNEDGCKILSRAFAQEETTGDDQADIGVSFQQQYDAYLSAFFVDGAPEGFSAIAEA